MHEIHVVCALRCTALRRSARFRPRLVSIRVAKPPEQLSVWAAYCSSMPLPPLPPAFADLCFALPSLSPSPSALFLLHPLLSIHLFLSSTLSPSLPIAFLPLYSLLLSLFHFVVTNGGGGGVLTRLPRVDGLLRFVASSARRARERVLVRHPQPLEPFGGPRAGYLSLRAQARRISRSSVVDGMPSTSQMLTPSLKGRSRPRGSRVPCRTARARARYFAGPGS